MPAAASGNSPKIDQSMQQVLQLSKATTNMAGAIGTTRTESNNVARDQATKREDAATEKTREAEQQHVETRYDNLEQKVEQGKTDSKKTQDQRQEGANAHEKLAKLGGEKAKPAELYQKAMAGTNSALKNPNEAGKNAQGKEGQPGSAQADRGNRAQLTPAQLARLQAAKTGKLPEAMSQRDKFMAFMGKESGPKNLTGEQQTKTLRYFKAQAELKDNQKQLAQLQKQEKGKEAKALEDKLLQQQGELAGEMAMARGELQAENPQINNLLTKFESQQEAQETKHNDEANKSGESQDASGADKSKHLATKDGVDKTQSGNRDGQGSSGQPDVPPKTPVLQRAPDQLAVAVQQNTMMFSIGDTADGDPRTEFQRRQEELMMQGHKACNRMMDGTAWTAGIINDEQAFARVVRHQGERRRSYDDEPVQELQGDDNDASVGMTNDNPVYKDVMRVNVPGTNSGIVVKYWETQGAQNLNADGSFTVRGPKGEAITTWDAKKLETFRNSIFGTAAKRDQDRFISPTRLAQGDLPEIYSADMIC